MDTTPNFKAQRIMTEAETGGHIKVKFGPGEWIGFITVMLTLLGIVVGGWTRLAVIETRMDELGRRFERFESRADREELRARRNSE